MSARRHIAVVWVRQSILMLLAAFGLLGSAGAPPALSADSSRAYEMVSPLDKNGGDVTGEATTADAAADGNAIAYMARGSFGDTIGSGDVGTQYVARRGTGGWTSRGISPTPSHEVVMGFIFSTSVLNFSDDVRRGVVWAFDLPAVTEDARAGNIYLEDTLTRELRLVNVPPPGPFDFFTFLGDFAFSNSGGVSRDSRHLAFKAFSLLLPEAPPGVPSVYEWDDGTLRLASVLPDGTVAADGAILTPENYRETVSPDGSRVLFVSPPSSTGQLYARVDHARTSWVSEPELNGAPMPENVTLQQVTEDSRHVLFTTTSRLVAEDTNDPAEGADLYLYTDTANPGRDSNLTLITEQPGSGISVVGSSDDARRIYFYDGSRIMVWQNDVVRVVASSVDVPPAPGFELAATTTNPGGSRVSPDGRYLAFVATGVIRSETGQPTGGESGGRRQIYLYDAESDVLRCVSCPPGEVATADATVVPAVTDMWPRTSVKGVRSSFLSNGGSVFFSTLDQLVAEDVNGVQDAYEFNPASGEVSLISTGTGSQPAAFVDAGENGKDVFFVTRQRLVKSDRDGLVDLYDARVGGGFPDPPGPNDPCVGDACQEALEPAPAQAAPGSARFEAGDAEPALAARLRILGSRVLGASRARLGFEISTGGTVRWAGRGLRAESRSFDKAGRYRVRLALTPAAGRRLARRGTLRVKVRLTFTAVDGASSRRTASLTFRSLRKGATR